MFGMMGRISGSSGSSSEHRKERHGSEGKSSPSHSSPSPNCQVTERPTHPPRRDRGLAYFRERPSPLDCTQPAAAFTPGQPAAECHRPFALIPCPRHPQHKE